MIKEFHFKQFNLALVISLHSVWMSNSSIRPIDRDSIWSDHRARLDLGAMAMKCIPHSTKFQYYWSLTIKLFNVISTTLIEEGGSYPSAEKQSVYSTTPAVRAALNCPNKWLIFKRIIRVCNTWNHLTVCNQMCSNSLKIKLFTNFVSKSYIWDIYYEQDLAWNKHQRRICH